MSEPYKASDNPIDVPDWITIVLEKKLHEQKWYQKYANTVTTAITGLLTLVWWLVSTGISLPSWTVYAVGVLLWVGEIVAVKQTKNGVTPSVVDAVVSDLGSVTPGRHHRGE